MSQAENVIIFLFQGTSVFKAVARDPDTGINYAISYTIDGEIILTLVYKQLFLKLSYKQFMFFIGVRWHSGTGCKE